jgi:hypothetical protein
VDLFLSRIQEGSPRIDVDRAAQLARIWVRQRDAIIDRMHEITRESGRVAWHARSRAEAIGEMARLLLFATERIVAHRTNGRPVDTIDPIEEETALSQPEAMERCENTARIFAERIWFRVYDNLSRKYPLIAGADTPHPTTRLPGNATRQLQPGTTRNHYIPTFTAKPWADAAREVRVFKRAVGGHLLVRTRGYRTFGHERFLYPQHLENWFADIEQAARRPYGKLVTTEVLTEEDRYFWIAFLTTQFLRTPSFMAAIAKQLRARARRERWPWPMTPALLRSAHAQLFNEDRVSAQYHRRFAGKRWSIQTAAADRAFPRTDSPVVAAGLDADGSWRCYYPLTPTQCFVVGPENAGERDVPAALGTRLSNVETDRLTGLLISRSRRSFITRCSDSEDRWLQIARSVPASDPLERYRAWGELHAP